MLISATALEIILKKKQYHESDSATSATST